MTENEDGARPARPMEVGEDEDEDSDEDYVPPETEPEERPRRSTRKKEKPTSSSKYDEHFGIQQLCLTCTFSFQCRYIKFHGRLFVRR